MIPLAYIGIPNFCGKSGDFHYGIPGSVLMSMKTNREVLNFLIL